MPLVSPKDPVVNPITRSEVSVTTESNFIAARGVAPETISYFGVANGNVYREAGTLTKRSGLKAGIQVVMETGNAACKNALPTRAGLSPFLKSDDKGVV